MAYTREQLAFAAIGAVESAHFYSAFLPSLMTIGKFAEDGQALQDLRRGEAIATSFSLLLGWVLSEFTDTYLPLLFTGIMAIAMLAVYESRIRQNVGAGAIGAAGITVATIIPGIPPFP